MKTTITLLALVLCGNAQAYLDPGAGSMLLQVILGGAAAVGVALKLYWHRILAIFGKGSDSDPDRSDP